MEGGLVREGKGRRVEGKGKAAGREGRAVGREGVRWWEGVHRLLGGQCWRRDHHGGREVGGRSRKAREARSIGRALRREARLQWGQRGTREGAHAGMGRASGGQRHWRQRGWRRQPRAESAIVASESCLWMVRRVEPSESQSQEDGGERSGQHWRRSRQHWLAGKAHVAQRRALSGRMARRPQKRKLARRTRQEHRRPRPSVGQAVAAAVAGPCRRERACEGCSRAFVGRPLILFILFFELSL